MFSLYDFKHLTIGGCAFLPSEQITDKLLIGRKNCLSYVNYVRDYIINNAKKGDIVFVGQSLRGGFRSNNTYFEHINDLSISLKGVFVPVILLDGTAPPLHLADLCHKEFYRPFPSKYCQTSRKEVISRYSKFDELAHEFTAKNQNLFYAPLREGLCDNDICNSYTENDNFIWTSDSHITTKAAKDLAPLLRKRLVDAKFYKYKE